MEERVQNHEVRISELERSYGKLDERMTSIEIGQKGIENTILKESSSQKEMVQKVIEYALDSKLTQEKTKSELSVIKETNSADLKKTKVIATKDIIIGLCGTGGIVFGIISLFVN